MFVVVLTPREAFGAYAVYGALIVVLTLYSDVPLLTLARRLSIETPFLLFAVALPWLARGDRVDLLGMSLSVEGLWGAWNIFAKATLGAATMMLLASVTPITSILHGLRRLRVPAVIVAIAGFMIRYADVIASEMRRMKLGRQSRGYEPRLLWQARAIASSAGTLFIRSYERGERVHLAMMSRGYAGAMPKPDAGATSPADWFTAFLLPAAAATCCIAAWL